MTEFPRRRVESVAVIGLGSIGARHAGNAIDLGLAVFGYDPDPAARERAAEIGVIPVSDTKELMREADMAVSASPSSQHHDDISMCLEADCPVLVEKPIGHDADVVAGLLQTAKERRIQVGSVFNLRHRRIVEALPGEIDRLGKPRWARFVSASWLPDWRPLQDYRGGYANDRTAGGVLFDVIHEIDLASFLLGPGRTAAAVVRRSGALELKTEDVAELVLEHADGCIASLHLDFGSRVRRRFLEISGESGSIHADLRTGRLRCCDASGQLMHEQVCAADLNEEYLSTLKRFVEAVRKGVDAPVPGQEGLNALRHVLAARAFGEREVAR
jgi:predicted dehydrogenase